ncbi:MAG: small multi-drug export protein, partial [Clostridia bacterium]|nr:small multi-drug export protein [Clostridia bacterium]
MLKQYLITFLISMVPLIELRGALPYALANGIPTLPAYLVCMVANMLPVPVIFFFARKVLEWGADKKYIGGFFTWCLE